MRPWLLIPGLLLVSALAHAQESREQIPKPAGPKAFRAGAAASNIPPPLGEPIVGNWTSPPATHVHDELHARCLDLDDGQTRLAFAVCDNVDISRQVFDAARALVHGETGLPEDNHLMAATHTHSATAAEGRKPLVP